MAIVLGSGLSPGVVARIDGRDVAYEKLHAPTSDVPGHPGFARAGTWRGLRVVAFAGRAHLYEGYDAHDVTYFVRLAAACGVKTIVLTNAAGGLSAACRPGDVMAIADHLNLTGTSPIAGDDPQPFVNMRDAYAPRLREVLRGVSALYEGVYAGVRGPAYETAAESEMLRRLGADAVGMSTVLGLSLITNVIAPDRDVMHAEVLDASRTGSIRIATILDGVIGALTVSRAASCGGESVRTAGEKRHAANANAQTLSADRT